MADPIKISALPAASAALLAHILAASNPDTDVTERLTVAQIAAILPSLNNPGAEVDVASAATVDLTPFPDTIRYRVTGATGITAFTMGNNHMALVRFAAGPTVTHHATTLILPTGANITAAAGDVAWLMSDDVGNVRVIAWFRASGAALIGAGTNLVDAAINAEQDVASAATTNLAAASTTAFRYRVTGTTGITAFTLGNNKMALLRFAGILTLTHNATTLILPTGANIVTEADDTALITTDGSGNVRVIGYWRKSGAPLAYGQVEEWIGADKFVPALTNGAQAGIRNLATNGVPLFYLAFDTATQEIAWLDWTPRKRYNGGTIRFVPYWTGNGGTAAQTMEFELAGRFYRDDDALDAAPGTAQASADAFIANDDLHVGPISAAITLAGTYAVGCLIKLRLVRDVANDTYAADAQLIGVKLVYTEDKGNDA